MKVYEIRRNSRSGYYNRTEVLGYITDLTGLPSQMTGRILATIPVKFTTEVAMFPGWLKNSPFTDCDAAEFTVGRDGSVLVDRKVTIVVEVDTPSWWGLSYSEAKSSAYKDTLKKAVGNTEQKVSILRMELEVQSEGLRKLEARLAKC